MHLFSLFFFFLVNYPLAKDYLIKTSPDLQKRRSVLLLRGFKMSNDVQPVLCLDMTADISPNNNDSENENGCYNANANTTDVCSLDKAFHLISVRPEDQKRSRALYSGDDLNTNRRQSFSFPHHHHHPPSLLPHPLFPSPPFSVQPSSTCSKTVRSC